MIVHAIGAIAVVLFLFGLPGPALAAAGAWFFAMIARFSGLEDGRADVGRVIEMADEEIAKLTSIIEAHGAKPTLAVIGRLDALTPTKTTSGYVYVVEFSSGAIKVGRTNHPGRRIREHRLAGIPYNALVTRVWVSTAHPPYRRNEERLIAFAAVRGVRVRKEYFLGASFDDVVEYARWLMREGALV